MNREVYSPLSFSLTRNDITQLRRDKILIGNQFNPELAAKDSYHSPLSKLLYAMAWKQGDLKKIEHIVQGIEQVDDNNRNKDSGLVFYHFGKYLTREEGNPIIDQHVLRAYKIYKSINKDHIDEEEITPLRKFDTMKKKDNKTILKYKAWITSDDIPITLRSCENYTYHIDLLLFAAGKQVKLN